MAERGTPKRPWRNLLQFQVFIAMWISIHGEGMASEPAKVPLYRGMHVDEKRYLGALAKNGRLPAKFVVAMEKRRNIGDQSSSSNEERKLVVDIPDNMWMEEKRHLGAFLKTHGKPSFSGLGLDQPELGDQSVSAPKRNEDEGVESSESSLVENASKRNVATLAGLGRLNAVRFGRFHPPSYGGVKRLFNDEMNDGVPALDDNEVNEYVDDCEEIDENTKEENDEDNYAHPNWPQSQKRYVAALARSGRLPVWHPQRMWWGGKRDTPYAYWMRYRSGARSYGDKRQNSQALKMKNKKCKKSSEITGLSNDKRNAAMLARKGMLPVGMSSV